MNLSLIYYPDPRLREVARPVEDINQEIREVLKVMIQIMNEKAGAGLSAPQVGYPYRLIAINLARQSPQQPPPQPIIMINPKIVSQEGEVVDEEGCLSLPGLVVKISRFENIEVKFTSIEGEQRNLKAIGFGARVIQHEIDHLDGKLIVDKMSQVEKIANAHILKRLEQDYESR